MRLSHLEQLQYFEDLGEKQPEWYPATLIRVVAGESLKEIAAELNCLGVVLREWIKRDDDREGAYQEALERKREMQAEELIDRTASAALATIQDARNGSGTDWLEVDQWPKGLLAAADSVEFSAEGKPYKIKMDSGRHADRLAKLLGMDKTGQTQVNITSLVSVLSGMPAGAPRLRPGAQAVEDATYSKPKLVAQQDPKVADAGEEAQAATPAGTLLLDNPPRQAVSG